MQRLSGILLQVQPFDADRNGTLGFAEYVALVQKLAPAPAAAGAP